MGPLPLPLHLPLPRSLPLLPFSWWWWWWWCGDPPSPPLPPSPPAPHGGGGPLLLLRGRGGGGEEAHRVCTGRDRVLHTCCNFHFFASPTWWWRLSWGGGSGEERGRDWSSRGTSRGRNPRSHDGETGSDRWRAVGESGELGREECVSWGDWGQEWEERLRLARSWARWRLGCEELV